MFYVVVMTPPYQHCTRPFPLSLTTKARYLSSLVSKETSCGLTEYPWVLKAKKGQNINVTLTSFSYDRDGNKSATISQCKEELGYVFDLDTETVINLCTGENKEHHVYLSRGSELQVLLDKAAVDQYSFIIKVEGKHLQRSEVILW